MEEGIEEEEAEDETVEDEETIDELEEVSLAVVISSTLTVDVDTPSEDEESEREVIELDDGPKVELEIDSEKVSVMLSDDEEGDADIRGPPTLPFCSCRAPMWRPRARKCDKEDGTLLVVAISDSRRRMSRPNNAKECPDEACIVEDTRYHAGCWPVRVFVQHRDGRERKVGVLD